MDIYVFAAAARRSGGMHGVRMRGWLVTKPGVCGLCLIDPRRSAARRGRVAQATKLVAAALLLRGVAVDLVAVDLRGNEPMSRRRPIDSTLARAVSPPFLSSSSPPRVNG